MNRTVLSTFRVQDFLGDEFMSGSTVWQYTFIIVLVTIIVVVLSTCFFTNSAPTKYLTKSLSRTNELECPEINTELIVYPYVVETVKNGRPYQEDRFCTVGRFNGDDDVSFYSVFDGHGGAKCSQFCANYLSSYIEKSINNSPYKSKSIRSSHMPITKKDGHKSSLGFIREMDIVNGFQLCDSKYREQATRDDGSTVMSIFLSKEYNQLITAHVGDSRAVMITNSSSYDLTVDHKPSNISEKERVELLGGHIIQYGVLRVQGVLAVTRALGDFSLRPFVSNVPTVNYYDLHGDECFIVIASDGLWDVLNHEEVAYFLEKNIHEKRNLHQCAEMLISEAISRKSSDNVITVMIIDLRKPNSTFGNKVRELKKEDKQVDDSECKEEGENESIQQFGAFIKENIEFLTSTINELEK